MIKQNLSPKFFLRENKTRKLPIKPNLIFFLKCYFVKSQYLASILNWASNHGKPVLPRLLEYAIFLVIIQILHIFENF